jgi:opacity protein-like surface antigen
MRKLRVICLLCVVAGRLAVAQDYPKAEVFGGYSFLSVGDKNLKDRQSLNGWEASASVNLTKLFALEGDVSGHYKSQTVAGISGTITDYTYAGGPRFNFKPVFVHALVGGDRVGASAFGFTASHTGLSVAAGGGVEYPVSPHWSLRVSADYVFDRHNVSIPGIIDTTETLNNVRVSAGVAYSFGGVAKGAQSRSPSPTTTTAASVPIPALGLRAGTRDNGAEIVVIEPGSVAALAGLHVTDVINKIDGKSINTAIELAAELSNHAPGSQVRLGYMFHSSALGYFQKETVVILGPLSK